MKAKLTCGIIKDLLPSYIEGLTGDESNQAIKEHLNECESCRNNVDVLNSYIVIDKSPQKEIEPLKKTKRIFIILFFSAFVVGILISIAAIFITEKSIDDALLTLVFLLFAIFLIFFKLILPIIGIVLPIIWMNKHKDRRKTIPIILIICFSLYLLFAMGNVISNVL